MNIFTLLSEEFQTSVLELLDVKSKMPVNLAMKVLKIKRDLQEKGQDAELIRSDIIEKFAERDESGDIKQKDGQYEIKKTDEFLKEWNAFLQTDVDFCETLKLTEEEFSKLNIELTLNQVQILMNNIVKN